jgi:enamine deaminase RidA (YjgF/YER057c/UK114 family)
LGNASIGGLHGTVVLLGLLAASLPATSARADDIDLSISGYDPVAYFTDGRPVQGKPDLDYVWHRLRWRFASTDHRDLFIKDPQRYAPQYDGYCAMGAAADSDAHKDTVDPLAWTIVDGKLYLVHDGTYWLGKWRDHAKDYIKRADADWQTLETLPDPVVVGPPCAASPPTTAVVLRDGRHWLMVGVQVPRDEAGKVVGKGDLRAQIEQVGKNVDACLQAGGAAVKDVVFTINEVTSPDALKNDTDLLLRYFGPPSPMSTTVQTPQLSDPDYLLQVQAVAAPK